MMPIWRAGNFMFYVPCLLGFILFGQPSFAETKTLVFASDSWVPFYGTGEAGTDAGYIIDVLTAIFQQEGIKVVSKVAPFNRAISDCNQSKISGIPGLFKADSHRLIFPKNRVGVSRLRFFTRTGEKWKYSGPESLKQVRFGVIDGYTYPILGRFHDDEGSKYTESLQISRGPRALEMNLMKLTVSKPRIDVIADDELVVTNLAEKLNLSKKIEAKEYLAKAEDLYVGFCPGPDALKLAAIFDAGLEKLKKEKKLQLILNKYKLTVKEIGL